MTQLTDKIREGVLGNVGTIIAGRLGITDAELIEKVFAPTFTAEDLHKTPNHYAVATVMMFGMPSTPFTMTWSVLGKENPEVLKQLKLYSATKYGRPRAEVSAEIDRRLAANNPEGKTKTEVTGELTEGADLDVRKEEQKIYKAHTKEEREENFLEAWMRKKQAIAGTK